MSLINPTHNPALRSWIASANRADTEFPIQNLPLGVMVDDKTQQRRVVTAIGDQVLDIAQVLDLGVMSGLGAHAVEAADSCRSGRLNELMGLGARHASALRQALSALLSSDSPHQDRLVQCLRPQAEVTMTVPAQVGDFSDFFTSIHHATNSGRLARPDNPLLPNFKHLPVAYHSRVSSLVVSGTPCIRPSGQIKPAGETLPRYAPTQCLDFECEVGFYVGQGSALGTTVPLEQAAQHVFGLSLLNDWSARDMQTWESQPLGPFLAKSFMSTLSPWVVTLEALAPFRVAAASRGEDAPDLLPYLNHESDRRWGGIDLSLDISILSPAMRDQGMAPHVISRPRFKDQYWTIFQMLTHQASNGCNLVPGDLFGSGTVSGPVPGELGCLKEITRDGREPVVLPTGEQRQYLHAGDDVCFRGRCEAAGFVSIGFGSCWGRVVN
jgi:fumarylacetoacetase